MQIVNNKSTSRICLSLSLLTLLRGMSLFKLFLHIKNIDFVNQAVLNIKKKGLTGLCHIESLYFVPSNSTHSHRNWSFLGCQVQRVAVNFFSHLYSFGNTKTSYFSKYSGCLVMQEASLFIDISVVQIAWNMFFTWHSSPTTSPMSLNICQLNASNLDQQFNLRFFLAWLNMFFPRINLWKL